MASQHRNSIVTLNEGTIGKTVYYLPPGIKDITSFSIGHILSYQDKQVSIKDLTTGENITVDISRCYNSNDELNPTEITDLTYLPHINDAAVLDVVTTRFNNKQIYTNVSPMLVAVNPFDISTSKNYTEKILLEYLSNEKNVPLPPHIFQLSNKIKNDFYHESKNQILVVSGESGSGKTETAKQFLRFISSNFHSIEKINPIQQALIHSNAILEAFGNAKTNRNENSSRFGRLTMLSLDKNENVASATINVFLLERQRVTTRSPSDKNFHIFYALIYGSSEEEKKQFFLLSSPQSYKYLASESSMHETSEEKAKYKKMLEDVKTAFNSIHYTAKEVSDIWRITSAILLMGNLEFNVDTDKDGNEVARVKNTKILEQVATLLCVSLVDLEKNITTKLRHFPSGPLLSPLTLSEVFNTIESIARVLFELLFVDIVKNVNVAIADIRMNRALQRKSAATSRQTFHSLRTSVLPSSVSPLSAISSNSPLSSFPRPAPLLNYQIGVLDIFGFEFFNSNNLPQLLINYTNEKIQNLFVKQVFEQYEKDLEQEGLSPHDYFLYTNNSPLLAFFEQVFAHLQEQTTLQNGQSSTFVTNLQSISSPYLLPSQKGKTAQQQGNPKTRFAIAHTVTAVEYQGEAFVETNRERMPQNVVKLLKGSSLPYLLSLFDDSSYAMASNETLPAPLSTASTLAQFRDSVKKLFVLLESSHCHFVRCIKSNEQQSAWKLDRPLLFDQLRALSVYETLALNQSGFIYRKEFSEFLIEFSLLSLLPSPEESLLLRGEGREAQVEKVLKRAGCVVKDYAIGKTKVCLRKEAVEKLVILQRTLAEKMKPLANVLLTTFKGAIEREKYLTAMKGVRKLQSLARTFPERKREQRRALMVKVAPLALRLVSVGLGLHRQNTCALTLQTVFRTLAQRRRYSIALLRTKEDNVATTIAKMLATKKAELHLRDLELQRKEMQALTYINACLDSLMYMRSIDEINNMQKKKRCCQIIQAHWRGYHCRKEYKKILSMRMLLWPICNTIRIREQSAITIQKHVRRFLFTLTPEGKTAEAVFRQMRRSKELLNATERISLHMQSYLTRKRVHAFEAAAVTLQECITPLLLSRSFNKQKKASIVIQKQWRVFKAQKIYLQAKLDTIVAMERALVKELQKKEDNILSSLEDAISDSSFFVRKGSLFPWHVSIERSFVSSYSKGLSYHWRQVLQQRRGISHLAMGRDHAIIVAKRLSLSGAENEGRRGEEKKGGVEIYAFGNNRFGQLGCEHRHPVKSELILLRFTLPPLTHVQKVVCGKNHTLLLLSSREVFAWGDNTYGQCGTGLPMTSIVQPMKLHFHSRLCPLSHNPSTGGPTACGNNMRPHCHIQCGKEDSGIVEVVADSNRSAAISASGEVFLWGKWEEWNLDTIKTNLTTPSQPIQGSLFTSIALSHSTERRDYVNALVSRNGNLFLFGRSKKGLLSPAGTEGNSVQKPMLVKYFQSKGMAVEEVLFSPGATHGVVRTKTNDLYQFGCITIADKEQRESKKPQGHGEGERRKGDESSVWWEEKEPLEEYRRWINKGSEVGVKSEGMECLYLSTPCKINTMGLRVQDLVVTRLGVVFSTYLSCENDCTKEVYGWDFFDSYGEDGQLVPSLYSLMYPLVDAEGGQESIVDDGEVQLVSATDRYAEYLFLRR